MPARPIKFGVTFGAAGAAQPWAAIRRFWQLLDRETVFDSAFTNDHFLPPFSDTGEVDPGIDNLEGIVTVAAGLEATERLRLGCLVMAVTYRHPGLVAKIAMTLDTLSGGRFELAIGAGWHALEHRAYGVPFPPMGERQDRLEESAALLRTILRAA
ncbi:MAG TPA: LLM class flavin-dependent oxidoreductase, partial [Dehalococcoidia bacterium]|nr:LLM class flavin-dependent oxidoreductase [Dehalococcoidia bacterium]